MKSAVIAIGNELLKGFTLNTNSHYIASKFFEFGSDLEEMFVLPDEKSILISYLENLLDKDIIILTGGLGPTSDDITKEVLRELTNAEMILSEKVLNTIRKRLGYDQFNSTIEIQKMQAMVVENARILYNKIGLAPGHHIQIGKCNIFALPGVPREMRDMFDSYVMPYLEENYETVKPFLYKLFKTAGITEAEIFQKVGDKISGDIVHNISFQPSYDGVRIRAIFPNDEKNKKRFDDTVDMFYKELENFIYGDDEVKLAQAIGNILTERNLKIMISESCTGGYISKLITDVPGSSKYFLGGYISYSNDKKMKWLKVDEKILKEYGAVSRETANAMIQGVLDENFDTDIAVSVTGIAGPGGGTDEKPVGLVYISVGNRDYQYCKRFNFGGDRDAVRAKAANKALQELMIFLKLDK